MTAKKIVYQSFLGPMSEQLLARLPQMASRTENQSIGEPCRPLHNQEWRGLGLEPMDIIKCGYDALLDQILGGLQWKQRLPFLYAAHDQQLRQLTWISERRARDRQDADLTQQREALLWRREVLLTKLFEAEDYEDGLRGIHDVGVFRSMKARLDFLRAAVPGSRDAGKFACQPEITLCSGPLAKNQKEREALRRRAETFVHRDV
ncbi:hypothetical protein JX265_009021 [Neoarthrinium moseri]|uniref:Uncharacterized protein n=1 Tax=Neoarthrinium moseri TaxID=1658444 RepID=A0A9P9WH51_9PEZI|nr:hypothetical protein JX265_009021 [Neoarthrinium moseri]